MKADQFADLLKGVKQGGEYLQGKRRPSRVFRFQPVDILRLRKQAKLSQERFAEVRRGARHQPGDAQALVELGVRPEEDEDR